MTFSSSLLNPHAVRELSPGLYTALPREASAPYDRKAMVYDAIVGRSIYHRVFWGTSAPAYARFAGAARDNAGSGAFAEIGCGSLLFTASMYRRPSGPTVLADRSLAMLRRGLARLAPFQDSPPAGITMLHADAGTLPVPSGVFSTILSLNLLHVPCDRLRITAEWARTLVPGRGRVYVSALVRSGRWSDGWLKLLHDAGELGPPFTVDELRQTVASQWAVIESMNVEGNMCFIVARHGG